MRQVHVTLHFDVVHLVFVQTATKTNSTIWDIDFCFLAPFGNEREKEIRKTVVMLLLNICRHPFMLNLFDTEPTHFDEKELGFIKHLPLSK